MIIELFLIFAFLFFVAVFFYKQALEEFDVLQIESNQLDRLPSLLTEQSFVVVRSIPVIQLWNPETVKEIPRIHDAPYGPKKLLEIATHSKDPVTPLYPKSADLIAQHTGVQTWAETTWLPRIHDAEWKRFLFSVRTEVAIGAKGLRKSVAYSTIILPTRGNLTVSVMPESSETFLPKQWQGIQFSTVKRAQAPLIGEIKYLDIKVRQGSALFVPPHWIVDIHHEEEEQPWFVWIEIHHPMSRLAQLLTG
jgi:hypothetical protein